MEAAFTPWTLFVDIGIISILFLVGKLMRVKIKIIQKLFIPPSLLAGFMALGFGPQGLGWLPLSGYTGTYAGILIAFIFGCLPLTFAPSLFLDGYGIIFSAVCLLAALGVMLTAYMKKWHLNQSDIIP